MAALMTTGMSKNEAQEKYVSLVEKLATIYA
jgi:acyl-CoA-binding protein